MSDVLERVRKIVIEHLDADPEKVTEKASFIDDLGADSLDNVELVMAFEEEFDIEIPDGQSRLPFGRGHEFHILETRNVSDLGRRLAVGYHYDAMSPAFRGDLIDQHLWQAAVVEIGKNQ